MKVFIVVWSPPNQSSSAMISLAMSHSPARSKTFSTKEKAEEFVKKLYEAASLIGVGIDARINENVID